MMAVPNSGKRASYAASTKPAGPQRYQPDVYAPSILDREALLP